MHPPHARLLLPLAAASAVLVGVVPAAGQDPTPTPTATATASPTATATAPPLVTPVPTVTVTPTATPARRGHLNVGFKAPYRYDRKRLALRGDKVRLKGRLRPATRGQRVLVRVQHGNKTLKTHRFRTRANGRFSRRIRLRGTGRIVVRATHRASRKIRTARGRADGVTVFAPSDVRYWSRGTLTRLFQRGLNRLKYPAYASGVYDSTTGRAVMAYRKVNSLTRSESPSAAIVRAVLRGKGGYRVRHQRAGHHVEADLSRQVLALVDGDRLVRVYPTSSGTSATPTILGSFRFYSKTPGTNAKGMVDSNYFIRGYAIHGYPSVPAYPASHGCLRIPIPNARTVYDWVQFGDRIIVEY